MSEHMMVRSGAACNKNGKWDGKGSWDRANKEEVKTRKENFESINWNDSKPETLEVVKSENGKTTYKVKI